jgi:hypothetical protein
MRQLILGLAVVLGACGSGPDEAVAPTSASSVAAPASAVPVVTEAVAAPALKLPAKGTPMTTPKAMTVRSGGAPCSDGAQCLSGVCEGQGCGGQGPTCATEARLCTKDLREYCGCDGATFMASGTCPGKPYKMRGACEVPKEGGQGRAAGAPCRSAKDCASGVCEGEGCDGKGPVCGSASRMCTKDYRPYCGCNGVTFRSSGSCPGRPYAHRGSCKTDKQP